jgi:hypothetical protein
MSPPIARPFPRFMSDTAQEPKPYGEWLQRLTDAFAAACEPLAEEAGAALDRETVRFFPDRSWGGRTYLPAVGRAFEEQAGATEYFGYVHFERVGDEEPRGLLADADFTDVTAADNPDWEIDLNDAVVGAWRADGGRGGEVTLIWGTPLVRGAIAATAELGSEVVDQAAVNDGRFSLLAVDAVHGFDDELFLDVKLWDRRLNQLASESLYDSEPEPAPARAAEAEGETEGDDSAD